MKQVFFLLLIFNAWGSFSQEIDLGAIPEKSVHHLVLSPGEERLYLFFRDSLSVIGLDPLTETRRVKIHYPSEDFMTSYDALSLGRKIAFVHKKGGMVYYLEGDSLIRQDRSFDHRMQVNSTLFVHRDTIFRYGGYGFWSHRNFFTFYNNEAEEWNILPPTQSERLPRGSEKSVVQALGDTIYILGGLTMDPRTPKSRAFFNEIWAFEKAPGRWSYVGKVPAILMDQDLRFNVGQKLYFTLNASEMVWVVDIRNNSFEIFKKGARYEPFARRSTFPPIAYRSHFYTLSWHPNQINGLSLVRFPIEALLGERIESRPLYQDYRPYYLGSLAALSVVLLFVAGIRVRRHYRRRNKIVLKKGRFYYRGKSIELEEQERKILKLLIKRKEEVVTRDLMEIVENEELHYAHNIKVKNNAIAQLDFKLKSVLGVEEKLIQVEKSQTDRRIKVYALNRNYFDGS